MATPPSRAKCLWRMLLPVVAATLLALSLGLTLGGLAGVGAVAMALLLFPFILGARVSLRQVAPVRQALAAFTWGETPERLPVRGGP